MNNQWFSKFAVWIVIALVLFTVVKQFGGTTAPGKQVTYSEFLDLVQAHRIKSVILPEQNKSDWNEIPEEVRKKMKVHFVNHIGELIQTALRPA